MVRVNDRTAESFNRQKINLAIILSPINNRWAQSSSHDVSVNGHPPLCRWSGRNLVRQEFNLFYGHADENV